jgi:hypothetical protein
MSDDNVALTNRIDRLERELNDLREMVEALQAMQLRKTWDEFTFPKPVVDGFFRTLGMPLVTFGDEDDIDFDDGDDLPDTRE